MAAFQSAFLAAAALLWASIFGYLLALGWLTASRRRRTPAPLPLPEVAIVIPTFNECRFIRRKLDDVAALDYPGDRVSVIVVDGGSTDGTLEILEAELAKGRDIRLCRMASSGKVDQLNHVLRQIDQPFAVITDVDTALARDCVRALVRALQADPQTAVVGAVVIPDTPLLEERLHWWFLGLLWWLEGEGLSTAAVSGVCYAVRVSAIAPWAPGAVDDIHVALSASATGLRTRLCPAARATELRTPRTPRELLRFRRRRGHGYVQELRRAGGHASPAPGYRIVRWMRIWHLVVAPKLAVGLTVASLVLAVTSGWAWAPLSVAAFVVPGCAVLVGAARLAGDRQPWWRLCLAAGRLLGLNWLALVTLAPRRALAPSRASAT